MSPFFLLFSAFVVVPLIEVVAFIKIGGLIGLWPTIGLTVLTAVLGATLARLEGMATLESVRQSMARGELPIAEVVGGVFLLVAAALLLTPGFVTDTIGFVLLFRPTRLWLGERVLRFLLAHETFQWRDGGWRDGGHGATVVIDTDYVEIDPDQR